MPYNKRVSADGKNYVRLSETPERPLKIENKGIIPALYLQNMNQYSSMNTAPLIDSIITKIKMDSASNAFFLKNVICLLGRIPNPLGAE